MPNTYQVAKRIEKYLLNRWSEDIQNRGGDAPYVFNKKQWEESGLGGGEGSAIVWEGFHEWTKPSEMEGIYQASGDDHDYTLFETEWTLEIF